MHIRRSGILLHITSLPSPFGIGDLGPEAYKFADFLTNAKQSIWQILPLNPASLVCGNSPYCSYSAFAGNTVLISPDKMIEDGFLQQQDLHAHDFRNESVSYDRACEYKSRLLTTAFERFRANAEQDPEFLAFCRENAHWLEDYSLFVPLKQQFSEAAWNEWPQELRDRREEALQDAKNRLHESMLREKFYQYLFFKQWSSLKHYCNDRNIQIMGDLPIYVSYDSADVWANPRIFKLDEERRPTFVAGVPPDYFSETGQLWGNPVYNWDELKRTRYVWWLQRFAHNLKLLDLMRLDHFRGFISYWEVPSSDETAINGEWVEAPAKDFFDTCMRHFPYLPIVAEDLGIITPDVREVMAHYGLPGMKLLIFAFGHDLPTNPYAPHNIPQNSVVYTGTHDNNTIRGWFRSEATQPDKERLSRYLGHGITEEEVSWEFIRMAMTSVAHTAIIPIQDVLALGEESRMNSPSVTYGNWEWRLLAGQLTAELMERLAGITLLCGRA